MRGEEVGYKLVCVRCRDVKRRESRDVDVDMDEGDRGGCRCREVSPRRMLGGLYEG
jgi:hypothetical protein